MYTLQKAKEEIDAVASHATAIAAYAIATNEVSDAKLESFKKEIIATIETKFAELERKIVGDGQFSESTALVDLGAKISLLTHVSPAPAPPGDRPADQPGPYQSGDHDQNHDQHDNHHQH